MILEVTRNTVFIDLVAPKVTAPWEAAMARLTHRYLNWQLSNDCLPLHSHRAPLCWEEVWDSENGDLALKWLNEQPEMQSDFKPTRIRK